MQGSAIRAARIRLPGGIDSWTVVDARGLPIVDAETYLHWLRARGLAANTVLTYARHLSLWFRWLYAARVQWEAVTFDGIAQFSLDLSRGIPPLETRTGRGRSRTTVAAVISAISEFLNFHRLEGRGPDDLRLTRPAGRRGRTSRGFLAHLETGRGVAHESRIQPRGRPSAPQPRTLATEEDFGLLMEAAYHARDRLLLSSLHDVGLRVGQAIGLRHGDLDIVRRRLQIVRRETNENGAFSKQPHAFSVDVPARFLTLYSEYLLDELTPSGIDSDYMFVNVWRAPVGRALSYSNARRIVSDASKRAALGHTTPHTLRHTHGTELARAGWTSAQISARLGHSSPSSSAVYVHLTQDDLRSKLRKTFGGGYDAGDNDG